MTQSFATFVPFLQWLGGALALLAVFTAIYTRLTPHSELRLIREGNTAAAVGFSGAILGYVLPLASLIVHGANLVDFIIWGVIAMVVQIAVYLGLRLVFRDYPLHIAEDHVSVAILGATVSVAMGILNAAAQAT